ncbi:F0F1 ATP synthase subunit epsilon [Carbonactinospora thermoautotrophica]|uniref:ATP synthase epsilon chain n=1 Tax=Carbonactinospora thermoautotrophica TaxID=1469144 RepID=A0A132MP06_9ACTN|nr:F0F1 ATP synthase subunit epsilon [Carbonactinospora thermoautotrophica]KWW99523.1 ATP synthase epsilon chain [Carbonactinospora thermoautotrophica]KWX04074.1 ATP synthase subunit epsilon [Carbonactinospora thermoautotrophica]KWX06827.1 ATP synthase subunit epsilon [Carbonactinospora thermoautotrophica]MCX9191896.1 F0F1 ATP synthase subunit epsilon [Carbonactinospora thermoautotrophica]
MAQLHVELVAPDRKVWSGEASIVIAKTVEGEIGIMSGHTPVLAVLQSGPVTIRSAAGEDVVAAVHGGFLSVADDVVTILAELCELPEEIDVAEAEAELQRATSGAEYDSEAKRRAETRLRTVGRTQ